MNAEMIARTIQLILAPVVMVSACAIMLGGLLGHYGAINDRLRSMARERLDLLRANGLADAWQAERLGEIDVQMPELLRRHRLMRDAILAIYCAILVLISSMFVIALATAANSSWTATTALLIFLAGTGGLMLGVFLTALELRISHRAIQFEAERVLSLDHL